MKKILEEKGQKGYEGCVTLRDGEKVQRNYFSVLYICIKPETLNKSFLFYYDRKAKPLKEQINEVSHIIYHSSWSGQVQLKNGSTKTLRNVPFWLGKWKNTQFKPEEHCKLLKGDGIKHSYSLVCRTASSSSGTPEYIQLI